MVSKRGNRSDVVFEELRRRILSWEYPPGFRLKEDNLCSEFAVSRIPVREALSRLSQLHLIEKEPNIGCSVKKWSIAEIDQMYEFRLALELYSVETLATRGVEPESFQSLGDEWRELLKLDKDTDVNGLKLSMRDELFHEGITAHLGNSFISSNLKEINSRLRFLRVKDITTVERLAHTCEQHLVILDAIAKGDVTSAKAIMRENIMMGKTHVENALKDVLMRIYETG